MEKWLTIREIAGELGVPESNLRYYRDRVSEFLPSTGRGRKRRFSPEAVHIFREVIEMVREGVALDKIRLRLANEKQVVYPRPEPQPAQALDVDSVVEKMGAELGKFSSTVDLERRNASLESQMNSTLEELKVLKRKRDGFIEENEEKNRLLMTLRVERDHLAKKLKEKELIIEKQKEDLESARKHWDTISQEIQSIRSLIERLVFKAKNNHFQEQERMPN